MPLNRSHMQRTVITFLVVMSCHQVSRGCQQTEPSNKRSEGIFKIVRPDGSPLEGADVWLGLRKERRVYDAVKTQMDLGKTDATGSILWQAHISQEWPRNNASVLTGRNHQIAVSHQEFGINLIPVSLSNLVGRTIQIRDCREKGILKNTQNFSGKVDQIEMWPTATYMGSIPERVREAWRTSVVAEKNSTFYFPMRLKELYTFQVRTDQCVSQVFAADCIQYFWRAWKTSELWLPELSLIRLPDFLAKSKDYDIALHTIVSQDWRNELPARYIGQDRNRLWQWFIDFRNGDFRFHAPSMPFTVAVGTKTKMATELQLTSKVTDNGVQCRFSPMGLPKKFPQQQTWTVNHKTGQSTPTKTGAYTRHQRTAATPISTANRKTQADAAHGVTWRLMSKGKRRPGLLLVFSDENQSHARVIITNLDGSFELPHRQDHGVAWLLEGGKRSRLTVERRTTAINLILEN